LNWDKQSIAAVLIGALVLIGWFIYGPKITGSNQVAETPQTQQQPAAPQTAPQAAAPAQAVDQKAADAKSADNKTADKAADKAADKEAVNAPAVPAAVAKKEAVRIWNTGSVYHIQPATASVEKITLPKEKFNKNGSKDPVEITNSFTEDSRQAFGIRAEGSEFTCLEIVSEQRISDAEYVVERKLTDRFGNIFNIRTTFKAIGDYRLQVNVKVINPGKTPLQMRELLVSGGNMLPWHKLSGDKRSSSQEIMTVEYCSVDDDTDYENADVKDKTWVELQNRTVRWSGVSNRFFAQLLKPAEPSAMQCERKAVEEGSREYAVNTSVKLKAFDLEPNGSKDFSFDYYAGPKYPKNLSAFDGKAVKVMHLGWLPIDFLAHIMLKIMNFLYSFIGSFGLSIILLTLLVRLLFFPITMKANDSMREMQVLAPKLKEIREKYKNEPMLAQTKMSELYKEHKVNPLSGCLPMLIQIPVFIALYYALGGAAELRGQSFLWIKDLAQPDTIFTIPGLNLGVNPLIIAWTALMVVQQKLTPSSMEPMQAKIMMAMPLIMLFVLYSLPAALTLYWTVSQIFSIAQMVYQNKLRQKKEAASEAAKQDKSGDKPKIVRS